MSAAGAKEGQRLLNTGSDADGTTFGPINAAYWKVRRSHMRHMAYDIATAIGTGMVIGVGVGVGMAMGKQAGW